MSRTTKTLVSVFLLIHLGAYAIRISPFASVAQLVRFRIADRQWNLNELARWYQAYTVTSVSGQLFAPLPARANVYVGAVVELADGARRDFRFPLPRDASGLAAKSYTYFHKLGTSLADKASAPFYADICRYIAREMRNAPTQPVHVQLIAFHAAIPLHSRPEVHLTDDPPWFDYTRLLRDEAQYDAKVLLDYDVRPEDLG